MKVAAVVVTYNRKDELIKNIKAVFDQTHQIDRYYIIDNHGTDNTKEFLEAEGQLPNPLIKYVYLPENIGGAGGFYTGVKMAYEEGFDYICLMDDDGRPADQHMMENLLKKADKIYSENKLLFLNSLVIGPDECTLSFGLRKENIKIRNADLARQLATDDIIVGTVSPFNGTLISRELIKSIGFPNKDFFIKGDDIDYRLRAANAGAFVATVVTSNYFHPILVSEPINILGKTIGISAEAPWKEYYRARNHTYIYMREKKYLKIAKDIIKQMLSTIMRNPQKSKTFSMIFKGLKDGLSGNLGATVKP